MATYKIKATMTAEIEYEIDADSEEQALSKFYAKDAKDIIDNSRIMDVETEAEVAELSEGRFKVHVTSVDYAVTYSDCWNIVADKHPGIDEDSEEFDKLVNAKVDEIKASLPQELDFEIYCEKEDLDYYVAEYISDETNWLVNFCEYKIVSVE